MVNTSMQIKLRSIKKKSQKPGTQINVSRILVCNVPQNISLGQQVPHQPWIAIIMVKVKKSFRGNSLNS